MQTELSPLISVVIPTYNHAKFLKVAISSVLTQTYQNFEIVLVDNNSTDDTSEVINSFRDSRIRVYKIYNNGIIAASRNLGVKKSKGAWVAYLDSDDYWYPTRLKCLVNVIGSGLKYDVISTDEYKKDKLRNVRRKLIYGPVEGHKYRSLLLYGNKLSPSATMVRKQFLVENRVEFSESPDLVTVEDYDYWLQLAMLDANFKFIRSFEGEYLVHGGNSSSYETLHNRNTLNLLKHHVFDVQSFEPNKEKLWKDLRSVLLFKGALRQLKSGHLLLFLKNLFNALWFSSWFLSKWIFARVIFFLRNRFF